MTRVFKTFVLWLLIAAMPIQGLASVIKASCGPQHHNVTPTLVAMAMDHHHVAAQGTPHDHAHPAENHVLADAEAAEPSANLASDMQPVHKTSYCSACAACCIGATAPPPSVSLTPVFSTATTVVFPPVVSFTGFIPSGLERPPRLLSA